MKVYKNHTAVVTPHRILVLGYFLITLTGAILLSLPISSSNGKHQPFIDSLFVASSGISTTGLSVVDIGSYYNLFGQIVLMCIFQIGGIGYMTFIIFLIYIIGIRPTFLIDYTAWESLASPKYRMLGRFFVMVLISTIIVELAGAISLTLFWLREFSLLKALYLGVFHSVSAFCTAGFSTFPDSLVRYKSSFTVNLTIMALSIVGAAGFFVYYDILIFIKKKFLNSFPRKLSLHTKITVLVSFGIMLLGTLIIFISEPEKSGADFLNAAFQSVSASTTDGFNTVDIASMSSTSLTMFLILMFVGASPGSTGGGIKTTTLGVIIIFLWYNIKAGLANINAFKREIPQSTIYKAFWILMFFLIITAVDMLILTATEKKASFLQILFETISALGNTGLSMGITSSLTSIAKIALSITMFIGRIGPLALGLFLVGRQKTLPYQYPQEEVFIG